MSRRVTVREDVRCLDSEAAKNLDALCDKGSEDACYNLAALLFFEEKRQGGDRMEIYEAMLVRLIEMMLDSGGFRLADKATDEAKMRRTLEEVLKKARERIEEKGEEEKGEEGADRVKTAAVAGRKAAEAPAKLALFKLLFWDEIR